MLLVFVSLNNLWSPASQAGETCAKIHIFSVSTGIQHLIFPSFGVFSFLEFIFCSSDESRGQMPHTAHGQGDVLAQRFCLKSHELVCHLLPFSCLHIVGVSIEHLGCDTSGILALLSRGESAYVALFVVTHEEYPEIVPNITGYS